MTAKLVWLAALAGLVMLAPLAAVAEQGDDENPLRPDDAAWVEDCPEDMMCALAPPSETDGGENAWVEDCPEDMMCAFGQADGNATRGGEACDFCRGDNAGDCVACTDTNGPADETTWGTDCPEGVWCLGDGPLDPPSCEGGPCEYDPIPSDDDGAVAEAPAAALVLAGLLACLGGVLLGHRRRG